MKFFFVLLILRVGEDNFIISNFLPEGNSSYYLYYFINILIYCSVLFRIQTMFLIIINCFNCIKRYWFFIIIKYKVLKNLSKPYKVAFPIFCCIFFNRIVFYNCPWCQRMYYSYWLGWQIIVFWEFLAFPFISYYFC